jgi:uncharacterized alpha/beta hydrolase family protein
MENASKALILAGAILIAIIVISLGVVIFRNMSATVKNEANLDKEQITTFNSKILPYIGETISGSQVNALMQYIRTVNARADEVGATITVNNVSDSNNIPRFETGRFYSVKGDYDDRGLITTLTVTLIPETTP